MSAGYKAPTDWRALCEELLQAWDAQPLPPYQSSWASVINRIRAALAESVGEGPTDEELFRIASDCAALYIADDRDYDNCSEVVAAMRGAIAADRSRFGRQPAPAADETMSWIGQAVARAIDEQMPAAVEPIPLAERKPGLEDCDEEGRCWLFDSQIIDAWVFREFDLEDQRRYGNYTHWLPATALPLPV